MKIGLSTFLALLMLIGGLLPEALLGQTAGRYTLSGHVIDAESRETLIGATVFAPEVEQGVYTNAHGFFSLTLTKPITQLRISYVGFETRTLEIKPGTNQTLSIELTPGSLLETVVVEADRRTLRQPLAGAVEVPVHIIKTTPALLGENDLMKSLQLLPGVQGGSDGSAGVHVRGGGPDENLIILDGVPVYNVDHLFGFFSVFTPEAVKKVDLYKGSFPARYGGRLSSVIDVRTNDGNLQKYKGAVSIGLLSAKAQVEGPIVKDRTSFNISARRSYLDVLMAPFISAASDDETTGGYYFYDLNAKVQHRFSDRDRVYLSFYKGQDKFYSKFSEHYNQETNKWDASFKWGNTIGSLRWNHVFSSKLFSDLTLAYTDYNFALGSESSTESRYRAPSSMSVKYLSGIRDIAAYWNLHYFASPMLELRFGLDYVNHRFKPEAYGVKATGEDAPSPEVIAALNKANRPIDANDAAAYIESRWHLGRNALLNLGLRTSYFGVDGKSYLSLQPRADLDVRLGDKLSTQLSYAHMEQNVHLLTSATLTLPADLWVPTTGHIRPMTSDQISLGAKYDLGKGWSFGADAYLKFMSNILEYKDGASFIGNSTSWERKVEMGEGRTYGLELLLMKQTGATTGWIGYTLARSERRFPDGSINQGNWFPYKYDRRHHVNIVVTHQLTKRTDISASWELYTGGTITLGAEKQHILIPGSNYVKEAGYVSERNNYRMPMTHRLNVSMNYKRFHRNGAESIWNFSVFNLYNAKNPSFIFPESITSPRGSNMRLVQLSILPLIPSVSYTYKF